MIELHLSRVLAATAVLMLLAPPAVAEPHAQTPSQTEAATPTPTQGAAAAKGDGKGDSAGKGDKATTVDRAARRDAQHAAQREELRTNLHGPVTDAVREQLKRHAQRVAKLERIRAVALEAKDKDAADRASKLLEKETAHYQKWLASADAKTGSGTATPAAAPPNTATTNTAAAPGTTDPKGGAR
jgi:hypothetical protein